MSTTTEVVSTDTISKHSAMTRHPPKQPRALAMQNQRRPSLWMLVAFAQSVFWMFGIPVLCRNHVWDRLFGTLIASHPTHGHNIAEFLFTTSIPPVFLTLYTLVMIPIYASKHPFFEQYKIQQKTCWPWFDPRPRVREDFWKLSLRSIRLTSFNMFVLVPILVLAKMYVEHELLGKDKAFFFRTDDDHWPSTGKNLVDVLALALIHEFGFYATHRMMHTYPRLYRYHKVHHEYKINTTLAAQHNHPIDYVLSICGPAVVATTLVPSSHSISQFQYILWILWANLDDHCGYAFPWSPVRWFPGSASTDEHEFHHSQNRGCYSSKLSCFNLIFGGYEHYEKYRSVRRDGKEGAKTNGAD